jgi:hypothetical protein
MTERSNCLTATISQVFLVVDKQRGTELGCEVSNSHAADSQRAIVCQRGVLRKKVLGK